MLRLSSIVLSIVFLAAQLGCGGGGSSSGVNNGQDTAVTISSISPISAIAGSPDLQLSIAGSNFDVGVHGINRIVWSVNGVTRRIPPAVDSTDHLTVTLPAALLKAAVTAKISVEIWNISGDALLATSNAVKFLVINPAITISPTTVTSGSPDLVLNITGGTFTFSDAPHKFNQAVWYADGQRTVLNTTFITRTQLTATIPASLLSEPTTAQIVVEVWDFQGDVPEKLSPAVIFTVVSPWDY
jgi:hypothetical protein